MSKEIDDFFNKYNEDKYKQPTAALDANAFSTPNIVAHGVEFIFMIAVFVYFGWWTFLIYILPNALLVGFVMYRSSVARYTVKETLLMHLNVGGCFRVYTAALAVAYMHPLLIALPILIDVSSRIVVGNTLKAADFNFVPTHK